MKKTSCQSIQTLLYMHRPGELSERELDKLHRHLACCPECSAIAKQLGVMQVHITELAQTEQSVPEPADLTAAIMNSVSTLERMKQYRREGIIKQTLSLLFNPRFRLSLASVIVFLIGSYIIQESVFMMQMTKLEKKMTQSARIVTTPTLSNGLATLQTTYRQLEESGLLAKIELSAEGQDIRQTEIDNSVLLVLLENNKNLKTQNELLLKLLQQKNPDFFNTLNRLGLEQQEIDKIMANKKELVRLFNEL